MFPSPIQNASPWMRTGYKVLLPVSLVLWLLPLIGVAITSVRPAGDLAAGNYFGMPSGFAGVENYTAVFRDSPIGLYILNSFK
ncbi:MAG: carbohydrate ABC transporter permease, partial [Rhizobiaceae bacterium]